MSSKIRNTTCFLSLLIFVYAMRQAQVSPGSFVRHNIVRFAQEQKLSETFCSDGHDGISFSSSESERAESYRNGISNMRKDDTLANFIERGESKSTFAENYGKSFIPFLVPWVVFLGLGILGCFVYLINWCCMNCACLKSRGCGCCQAPKSPRFKNCFVVLSVLFMVFTVGAGIAGIIFVSEFPKYSNSALCSMVKFIEKAQDGSEDDKWIGFGPGINKIDELVLKVNNAVSGLSIYDTLLEDFDQSLNQVSNSLNALYDNNKDRTLDRINPDEGTYQPFYIQELGPSTQDGTVTNIIGTELDKSRQTLADNKNTLENFRGDVKDSTDKVVQDILDNRPTLVEANDWLTDALNGISKNKSIIDQIIGAVNGLLLGLTIANVSVAAIAAISILLVCCGAKLFNKSVHFSWCTIGLLMIVGWIISTVLFAATIILSETCDVGNQAIQSPEFFNKTFDRISTMFDLNTKDFNRTRGVLYRCVHGDGDLSQEFNLSNNLVFFNDIFTNINQISADATQNLNSLPDSISDSQVSVLNEFKEGLVPDSEETIEDLVTLNVLTDNEANTCTSADDMWVLNSQNCTSSDGTLFTTTSTADFNVPQATCIGYNTWSANQHDITNRYTQSVFSGTGCDNTNDATYVISFINSLANNRQQSNTLINDLELGVNDLDVKYTSFKAELQRTPQTLEDTNSTVVDIYTSLTDEQNGLIANTNCKFIVSAVEELRDVTCTGLGATVFKTTIAFLVLSFVTFFGTLFLFCLAKRFTVKAEGKKVDAETYVVGKVEC